MEMAQDSMPDFGVSGSNYQRWSYLSHLWYKSHLLPCGYIHTDIQNNRTEGDSLVVDLVRPKISSGPQWRIMLNRFLLLCFLFNNSKETNIW